MFAAVWGNWVGYEERRDNTLGIADDGGWGERLEKIGEDWKRLEKIGKDLRRLEKIGEDCE